MERSLKGACIAEFIGTGLIIFFGVGCVAAAQLAGATFGLWEISIMWAWGLLWRYIPPQAYPVRI